MCIFSNWTTGELLALGSLLVSLLTLGLGYVAYNSLLASEAKKRQLTLILDLIADLSEKRIQLLEANPSPETTFKTIGIFNIFEIARLSPFETDLRVFTPNMFALFESSFFNDPLMPNEISTIYSKLRKIKRNVVNNSVELKNIPDVYISLGWEARRTDLIIVGSGEKEGGINKLLNECSQLNKAIIKWLHKYGVTDTNSTIISKIK